MMRVRFPSAALLVPLGQADARAPSLPSQIVTAAGRAKASASESTGIMGRYANPEVKTRLDRLI